MAVQTCDQAITFRNFDYSRALEVVQDEEYLDDVDFDDDIRLSRKQGEVFKHIDSFEEKIANNFIQSFHEVSEDSEILSEFDYEYQESHHREKRFSFFNTSSTFCTNCTLGGPTLRGLGAAVLTSVAILIAANPAPGLTPSNSPQPGSPGGGGLPSANPGNILALVPAGLVAVATFPPFLPVDRVIPAVAVIFREPSGTVAGTDLTNKRSSSYSPQPTLWERFLKNVRCLGPRLSAKFGKKPAPVVDYGYGKKKRDTGYGYHVQEECGTIEDCFDNYLPCPRYGIVVKATFTRPRTPSYGSGYGLTERQTGEGFKSAAPPDCRVTG